MPHSTRPAPGHVRGFARLAALGLALSAGFASAAGPLLPEQQAREIFLLSGLDNLVDSTLEGFASGVEQSAAGVPGTAGDELAAAGSRGFDTAPLHAIVVQQLRRDITPRHATSLLDWYNTPLGKQITRIERENGEGIDPAVHMQAQIQRMTANPPSAKRSAQIAELLDVTGGIDMLESLMESAMLASAFGVNASQPEQLRASPAEITRQLQPMVAQMTAQMEPIMSIVMADVYRDLSDAELARYVDFYASDAGQALNDVVIKTLSQFLTAQSYELGRRMGLDIRAQESRHAL